MPGTIATRQTSQSTQEPTSPACPRTSTARWEETRRMHANLHQPRRRQPRPTEPVVNGTSWGSQTSSSSPKTPTGPRGQTSGSCRIWPTRYYAGGMPSTSDSSARSCSEQTKLRRRISPAPHRRQRFQIQIHERQLHNPQPSPNGDHLHRQPPSLDQHGNLHCQRPRSRLLRQLRRQN